MGGSLPFKMTMSKNGTLSSIGFDNFNGQLGDTMTAHPKLDPKTGELIFFCYEMQDPFAWYGVMSPDGVLQTHFRFSLPHAVMIHDMFVSEHWTAIFDSPV